MKYRFAKRKLDEYVFLGNRLQVSYAPQFETLSDTKEKLECRRKEVLARLSRKLFIINCVVNSFIPIFGVTLWKIFLSSSYLIGVCISHREISMHVLISARQSKGLTVRKSDNLGEASVNAISLHAQINSGQR